MVVYSFALLALFSVICFKLLSCPCIASVSFAFTPLLCLLVQATNSFDGMGSKAKIADVVDAFGTTDSMSISDLFGKSPKKKTHKVIDPPSDVI